MATWHRAELACPDGIPICCTSSQSRKLLQAEWQQLICTTLNVMSCNLMHLLIEFDAIHEAILLLAMWKVAIRVAVYHYIVDDCTSSEI